MALSTDHDDDVSMCSCKGTPGSSRSSSARASTRSSRISRRRAASPIGVPAAPTNTVSDGSPASPEATARLVRPSPPTYGTVALKRSTSMTVAMVPGAGVMVPASRRSAPSEPKTADAQAATPPRESSATR